jgi:hypothetical protein
MVRNVISAMMMPVKYMVCVSDKITFNLNLGCKGTTFFEKKRIRCEVLAENDYLCIIIFTKENRCQQT